MKPTHLLRPALFLLAASLAAPAFAQLLSPNAPVSTGTTLAPATNQVEPLDRMIAVVNDGVVLQSQLNSTLATVAQQIAAHGGQPPAPDVLKKQVLQRLILNELLVQRANDNGVRISDDQVNGAVANIAKENKLSVPQLQAAMQRQGMDYTSFRQQLRDQLLAQAVQRQIMQQSSQVSDAEVENLVSSPAFKEGEVHLARILIGLPEGANATQIAAAKQKADAIASQLAAGKNFAALAVSNSNAPEALDGGDMGWIPVDELPPQLQQVINGLQPGSYTQPLHDASGFTILQLEGKRTPDTKQIVTEFHARHLMLKPTAVLDEAAVKAKITKLYDAIVHDHADFATVAKQNSDDTTTANTGGDMGWFMQDDWGTQVGQMLTQMQPNQVTPPFESPDGSWHIIQLLGSRQADKTQELERERARQAIAARKGRQAYDQFTRDLRTSAYIHVLIPALADSSLQAPNDVQ